MMARNLVDSLKYKGAVDSGVICTWRHQVRQHIVSQMDVWAWVSRAQNLHVSLLITPFYGVITPFSARVTRKVVHTKVTFHTLYHTLDHTPPIPFVLSDRVLQVSESRRPAQRHTSGRRPRAANATCHP